MDLSKVILQEQKTSSLQADVVFDVPSVKEGIVFNLRFIDKHSLKKLREKCSKIDFDPKSHTQTQSIDGDLLLTKIIEKCISGWSKFTYKKLVLVAPINAEVLLEQLKAAGKNLESEIEFSKDTAFQMIRASYSIEPWLTDKITNIAVFQLEKLGDLEEQLKNSGTSPIGN